MEITIGTRKIGDNHPVFIIAELSANHLQNYDLAKKTIKAVSESGADAIKFQTYTPDTITINSNNECFMIKQGTLWDGQTLYDLYKDAYMPWEWQPELKEYAESIGLICFSTPFDKTAVDFLEKMNVQVYKIASFEITDIPLIEYIASKNKPIIISTGIARLTDIEEALETCRNAGNNDIILLKCTSEYPAAYENMNISVIGDMIARFDKIVGLSDHSLGITADIVSVAFGARVIEKHFILDKKLGGPDSSFSLMPEEFRDMVLRVREAEKSIGNINYDLSEQVIKNRDFSRSLFAVEDIIKDEKFTENNVRSIRPGFGLHPKYYKKVINSKASEDIKKGTPLSWNLIK